MILNIENKLLYYIYIMVSITKNITKVEWGIAGKAILAIIMGLGFGLYFFGFTEESMEESQKKSKDNLYYKVIGAMLITFSKMCLYSFDYSDLDHKSKERSKRVIRFFNILLIIGMLGLFIFGIILLVEIIDEDYISIERKNTISSNASYIVVGVLVSTQIFSFAKKFLYDEKILLALKALRVNNDEGSSKGNKKIINTIRDGVNTTVAAVGSIPI